MKKFILLVVSLMMTTAILSGCSSDNTKTSELPQIETTTEVVEENVNDDFEYTTITLDEVKDIYGNLENLCNVVSDGVENGSIKLNSTQKKELEEAQKLVDEKGELEESDFSSEKDMVDFANKITKLADALSMTVGVD